MLLYLCFPVFNVRSDLACCDWHSHGDRHHGVWDNIVRDEKRVKLRGRWPKLRSQVDLRLTGMVLMMRQLRNKVIVHRRTQIAQCQ